MEELINSIYILTGIVGVLALIFGYLLFRADDINARKYSGLFRGTAIILASLIITIGILANSGTTPETSENYIISIREKLSDDFMDFAEHFKSGKLDTWSKKFLNNFDSEYKEAIKFGESASLYLLDFRDYLEENSSEGLKGKELEVAVKYSIYNRALSSHYGFSTGSIYADMKYLLGDIDKFKSEIEELYKNEEDTINKLSGQYGGY